MASYFNHDQGESSSERFFLYLPFFTIGAFVRLSRAKRLKFVINSNWCAFRDLEQVLLWAGKIAEKSPTVQCCRGSRGVRRASCCCSDRAARLLTALVSIDRTGFDRFAACALAVTARRQPLLGPGRCACGAQPLPRSRALEVQHLWTGLWTVN